MAYHLIASFVLGIWGNGFPLSLRREDVGLKPDAKRGIAAWPLGAVPSLLPAFLWLFGVLVLGGCSTSSVHGNLARVILGGRTFQLEIAADDNARIQGLSDRKSIAEDGGMIFVFPDTDQRDFVMRRCPIPIDIIFLDPTGRIVQMYAMKPEPPQTTEDQLHRYSSDWPAQFAIELRGGTLEHLGLTNGQKVELPQDELKKLRAMTR